MYNDFINKISNMADYNEIRKSIYDMTNYFKNNQQNELADKIEIDAINSIKNQDNKIKLIIDLYCNNYDYRSSYFNWNKIVKLLTSYSNDERNKILNKIFSITNIKYHNQDINIPGNITYGVELEYWGVCLSLIKNLYKTGIINNILDSLNIPSDIKDDLVNNSDIEKVNQFSKWIYSKEIHDECSEISTPIMTDKDKKGIDAICTFFSAMGATTNSGTGMHINIGTSYFQNNKKALIYLLMIWSECENLFYKIANEDNEKIRQAVFSMAQPIKKNIQTTFNNNDFSFDRNRFIYNIQMKDRFPYLVQLAGRNIYSDYCACHNDVDRYHVFEKYMNLPDKYNDGIRYNSINFSHLNWGHDDGRIEFRLFNSNTSSKIVLENILLVTKLCETSLNLALNNSKKDMFDKLLNHDVTEEEKINNLLDLLFDNEDEKSIFKSRWESVKDYDIYNDLDKGQSTYINEKRLHYYI